MSELKRATLMSIGSEKVDVKRPKETHKTVRISVLLPQSTEDKCPEFNYKDEVAALKKRDNAKSAAKQTNGLDPFNEDDDDVKRIAAEMEAKYGGAISKRRKWRKDDFADIGMGYDENDPFIDNTDGYDEVIPKDVTTLRGGFYINSGALEFKIEENISTEDSSSSDEEVNGIPASRKRALDSSPGSEMEPGAERNQNGKAEKKHKLSANGMQKALKKRLFSHEKIKQMRRKRSEDNKKKTVRELLKEKRVDLNLTVASEITDVEEMPEENKVKALASVDDVIESVISSITEEEIKCVVPVIDESSKDSASSREGNNKPALNSQSDGDSNDASTKANVDIVIVPLPENLSSDILEVINSIKEAAAASTEGKVKFFTGPVNVMLLNLERKCRCLGKQSRLKVYEHLAPFVKCRKETLIKRAKKLTLDEEVKKMRGLLDRLKISIANTMPELVEKYERDTQRVLQKKFSKDTEGNEDNRAIRMPHRRFHWTDQTKKLIKDIISVRKRRYILEGKRKDSLEALITTFLKTEVKILWPEGWMSVTHLMKFYSSSQDPNSSVRNMSHTSRNVDKTLAIDLTNSRDFTQPLSVNSSLTITPVPTPIVAITPSANEMHLKAPTKKIEHLVVNNVIVSEPETSKPPPSIEIIKTSPATTHTTTVPSAMHAPTTSVPSPKFVQDTLETVMNSTPILIEESPVKKDCVDEQTANLIATTKRQIESLNSHVAKDFQMIDLTARGDLKRRPGPKSKTKYYCDGPDKIRRKVDDSYSGEREKDELTGTAALNQIITESLGDLHKIAQSNANKANSTMTDSLSKNVRPVLPPPYDPPRLSDCGDDFKRLLESLNAPSTLPTLDKINNAVRTSSPVSVIAFNKNFSHKSTSSSQHASAAASSSCRNSELKTGNPSTSSFQDAFQKQFINEFNALKASHTASTKAGVHSSSSSKSHASYSSNDKYLQASNNNYPPQNHTKLKNNFTPQQSSGPYNMLDDMFTNFLNEYGYTKTANHKPSAQQK